MTFVSISARLLLAGLVFLMIFLSWRRPLQKMPVYAAQRMCPHCGRITPRAGTACLECGGVLTG